MHKKYSLKNKSYALIAYMNKKNCCHRSGFWGYWPRPMSIPRREGMYMPCCIGRSKPPAEVELWFGLS